MTTMINSVEQSAILYTLLITNVLQTAVLLMMALLAFKGISMYRKIKMDLELLVTDLINDDADGPFDDRGDPQESALAAESPAATSKSPAANRHRDRLSALAAGGKTKEYIGKTLTSEQIEALSPEEVERLYSRYEAKLGAMMTKCIGHGAIKMYAGLAVRFLPIPEENNAALVADLEEDPFVEHALNSAACELYHRYGMWLAPITTAATTLRHCRFEHTCPRNQIDSEYGAQQCSQNE